MKKSRRRRQTDTSKEDLLHPIIRKIPNTTIGARAFVMIADLCNNGKDWYRVHKVKKVPFLSMICIEGEDSLGSYFCNVYISFCCCQVPPFQFTHSLCSGVDSI